MKIKHLVFLLTMVLMNPLNAQILKKGDNLKVEFSKIEKPYYFKWPFHTGFIEERDMQLIGSKPNPLDCNSLFIAHKDNTLIGAYVKKPGSFLMDTKGDFNLNLSSEFFILPLWLVKTKTKLMASDKKIIHLLDKLYEQTLQGNENSLDKETIAEYQSYKTDASLANRHIALLFHTYQNIIMESTEQGEKPPAELCIMIMKSLSDECLELYNKVPVTVCIYMGEALDSGGFKDEARIQFKKSLEQYPDSIPLLVYNYRFEQDEIKKKQQLKALKQSYSKHWMVRDL